MRKIYPTLLSLTILIALAGNRSSATPTGNDVIPGSIRADATFEHIGVLWWISGDDDLDSDMTLEFRRLGESAWQQGAPAMRAYPTIQVDAAPLGLDYWAASAMFLEPGETYELRLTLTDPDGGSETQIVTATTRTWPQPDPAGRQLFVVPGSGGGDGSPGNPFQGLQTAADAAQPGDVFYVAAGTYGSFQLSTSGTQGSPITFIGPGDGSAIVDGANTSRGIITLGINSQTVLEHIILQGLTIQNGRWGIDAQNTRDIYIHHNIIQDVGYGVYNRRSNGWEYNQIVCDNTITGRISWPGSGIPRERGIDLRGDGNVVCYNTVQSFGDCISVQPYTGPSYGNDVYGNDASYCVDDGIEIDYNQANARVWRNRVMNSCKGISLQPIYGGPAYIFRNELFNIEIVPLKMYNYTTGFYVVHNTSVKHSDGHGDKNEMWRNVVFRNNLFLGTRYAFEFLTVADEGFRDLDYNAWGTTRAIGNANAPYFKWDDVSYGTMTDLPPGVEDNGIPAVFGDLVNAALSASWDTAVPPSSRDLRLAAGAPEIDAGVSLPNLNDGFAISGLPDMGAFEYGQPLPQYGPRPATPDLSTSFKRANFPNPALGEVVTFTISIQNTAWPLAETISLTDTIPSGLTYVPGSLTASSGTPDDGAVPTLRWSGFLGSATAVTISYAVTVTETEPRPINNTVTIDAGSAGVFNFSAAILVNGRFVYLPVVVK